MRGGVGIDDLLFTLSKEDLTLMGAIIEENIELTQKSGMPLI
jgi:hypothetical protein